MRKTSCSLLLALAIVPSLLEIGYGLYKYNPADLHVRLNEVACIKQGINPFDIWDGSVVRYPFYPYAGWRREGFRPMERGELMVHAYSPWGYCYMYPFSFLSHRKATRVFLGLQFAALALILLSARNMLRDVATGRQFLLYSVIGWLVLGGYVASAIQWGNFGILCACFLLGMILCLERHWNLRAGVLWGLLMVKPQLGLLFAIPLFFSKKIPTMVVAVLVCCAATVLPSVLTHTPPHELVLNMLRSNTGYVDLLSGGGFSFLVGTVPPFVILLLNTGVFLPLCLVTSWQLRKHQRWVIRMTPAAVCSVLWTYSRMHDFVVLIVPLIGLALAYAELRDDPKSRHRTCALLLVSAALPLFSSLSFVMLRLGHLSVSLQQGPESALHVWLEEAFSIKNSVYAAFYRSARLLATFSWSALLLMVSRTFSHSTDEEPHAGQAC